MEIFIVYFLIEGKVNYIGEYKVKRKYLPHEQQKEEDKKVFTRIINFLIILLKHFIFKNMVPSSYFGEIEIIFKKKRHIIFEKIFKIFL